MIYKRSEEAERILKNIYQCIDDNGGIVKKEQLAELGIPIVVAIKEWVDAEYENGRQNSVSTHELEQLVCELSGGKF